MIAPFLFLLLAQSPQPAAAQGRGQPQTQTQTPAGRRGGAAEPSTPAIAPEVDETPVVTHHTVTVAGKTLNYTATVAQMPL